MLITCCIRQLDSQLSYRMLTDVGCMPLSLFLLRCHFIRLSSDSELGICERRHMHSIGHRGGGGHCMRCRQSVSRSSRSGSPCSASHHKPGICKSLPPITVMITDTYLLYITSYHGHGHGHLPTIYYLLSRSRSLTPLYDIH